MTTIMIPVAPGELIDKITILTIKSEKISGAERLANVRRELEMLDRERAQHIDGDPRVDEMQARLEAVNRRIWDLEDVIRSCERERDFGKRFLDTARQIYRNNDERATIKKEINLHLGSLIIEEKSYAEY